MSCPKQNKAKQNIEPIQVNAGKNGLWAKLSFWYEKIMSYLVISGRPSSQHKKETKTKHWEDD